MRKLQHKGVRSLLICLLAVVFVLPLAACSGKPKTSSTSGTATTTDPDMNFTDDSETTAGEESESTAGQGTESTQPDQTTGGQSQTNKPTGTKTNAPPIKTNSPNTKPQTTVSVKVEEVKNKIDVKGKTCTLMTNNSATTPDGKLLVDNFKKYCNGNLKMLTYDYMDLAVKLQASVLAKNPPDVYLFRNQDFPQLLYKDYLESLNGYIDFKDAEWANKKDEMDAYIWGDQYYLVPDMRIDQYIWYNKTIFEDAGVDTPADLVAANNWTWDTMFEIAEEVADEKSGIAGFASGSNLCYAIMASANTDLVKITAEGVTNNINAAEVTKAMNYEYKLMNSKITPKDTDAKNVELLKQGKLALLFEGRWLAQNDATLAKQRQSGDIDMVMFPRMDKNTPYRSMGAITGYAVPKGVKNADCAKAFVTMVALNGSLKEEHENALHTIYKDTTAFKKIYQQTAGFAVVPAYSLGISSISTPYWQALNRLNRGTPWSTLSNELKPTFDQAINNLGK